MKKLIIWNWLGALIQNLLEHIIKHADRSSLAQSWCGRLDVVRTVQKQKQITPCEFDSVNISVHA